MAKELQSGDRFQGYRVERLLGRGGMGAVYLVRHQVLDTQYALKVLDETDCDEDSPYVKRFLREARLATHIHHPNLVEVHDCGHDNFWNLYYLVMDFVPGNSLRVILGFEQRLSVERAANIVIQVSSALVAASAFHVVHRDIKPENIMIQPDGNVKLLDLGVAKADDLGESLSTNTDSVFGTPSYSSPEQLLSTANVDARADVYSLGIVFYEMLAGRCPYDDVSSAQVVERILSDDPTPDVRDAVKGIPAEVAVLIRRMTIKEVDRRLPSFEAVLAELAKLGYHGAPLPVSSVQIPSEPEVGMKTLLGSIKVDTAKPASHRGFFDFFKRS